MSFTTPCPRLPPYYFLNLSSGRNRGRRSTGASCRIAAASSKMSSGSSPFRSFRFLRHHMASRDVQSQSSFFWSHNTNMQAAMNILRDGELIRPSKWQEHPSPNRECSNWNEVWLPPIGFYCRGRLQSQEAAVQSAAQFAGIHTARPVCIPSPPKRP